MKTKEKKKLGLEEAENKLLDIISRHLAKMPKDEAEKRIEKAHDLITRSQKTPSKS